MKRELIPEGWYFLVGYPLEEAIEVLEGEAVDFIVKFTAPPSKSPDQDEAIVISVRSGEPIQIICASPDWTVN